MTDSTPEIILCIPGQWSDRTALVTAIATQSDGYLFAGGVMMHVVSQDGFEVQVDGVDPRVPRAFELAGRRSLTPEDMLAIQAHTQVLYLIGPGGSTHAARRLMLAGVGLLKAGGLAVKVETTGSAHNKADWQKLAAHEGDEALYYGYVTLVGGDEGAFYSTGMQNLGLPDAIVRADLDPQAAANLLHNFLLYLLVEKPTLQAGQTFGLEPGAPIYRLSHEGSVYPETHEFYYNPYGTWRLSAVEG